MFPTIQSFHTIVKYEVLGSDNQPVPVETEILFERIKSQDDEFEFNPGLAVHCLAPAFVNAVNARVRELNEADPDTTFKSLY